jgi:RNA polymerase sigma-70 factor, ECF subfamily
MRQLSAYLHFHGVGGALLLRRGRNGEAGAAFDRAISLAGTPAQATHIRRHLDRLQRETVIGA